MEENMLPDVSRRQVLRAGGAGLSTGFAGCSAVGGIGAEPTELLFTLWNFDTQRSHEVYLEVYEADAVDSEDGEVLERDFELARAADTEAGEEPDEGSQEEFRIESRPYLVRVQLSPAEYTPSTTHFHFHPCTDSDADDVDRLFVHLVRDEASDELFVQFHRPNC